MEEKDKQKSGPLSPDQFRTVLQKVKDLGLTWTADVPPRLTNPKTGPEAAAVLSGDEVKQLQRDYPGFPGELGVVAYYALTGRMVSPDAGNLDLLREKVEVLRESSLLSDKYRAEFFFKHAIKVPYFSDVDWEVVVKTYERNVRDKPRISYALLSLRFDSPAGLVGGSSRSVTVAVDEGLVSKLIRILSEVKTALEKSRDVTEALGKLEEAGGKKDGIADRRKQLG